MYTIYPGKVAKSLHDFLDENVPSISARPAFPRRGARSRDSRWSGGEGKHRCSTWLHPGNRETQPGFHGAMSHICSTYIYIYIYICAYVYI